MQLRRVRLGDILDDYCPRERRITNHAVVAMIDDEVKQTRCATCSADHEYKQGKAPAPRRKKSEGVLFAEGEAPSRPVLATAAASQDDNVEPDDSAEPIEALEPSDLPEVAASSDPDADADADADADTELEVEIDESPDDVWVHRPLIRATLPRPEGHVPERKEPDFTMRGPAGARFDGNRNGQRHRGGGAQQQPRGHRPMRHAQGQQGQPGNSRQGAGSGGPLDSARGRQGQRQGNRPGQPQGQRGGGQPQGQSRGPRPGGGRGPKRGR